MSRIDGTQDALQTLVQHKLYAPSASPPRLVHVSTCVSQHSHRALWDGILSKAFLESFHNDRLSVHRIVSKITLLSLQDLRLLWIPRRDLVRTLLSGGDKIEQLLLL